MLMLVEVTSSGSTTSDACRCELHRLRIFRLEIDEKLADAVDAKVRIDHWPSCSEDTSSCECCNAVKTGDEVDVKLVAPSDVRIVQYLALAPAEEQQMTLALPFVKSLLRGRILAGRAGSITLERDGLKYGEWRYEVFFRGCSGGKVEAFDGGLVTDQTLVLMFPSATSPSTLSLQSKWKYQPVGAHARGFHELVAMALRRTSIASADGAVQTIAAPHSLLLHAPSGAGKTTLVHQIAEEMGAICLCWMVPDKQWTVELLASLLPSSNLLRHEFLMSLAVRYGQRPSNIASIAQQICTRLSSEDSQDISVETLELEIAASARGLSVPAMRVKQNLIEMVVWPLEKPEVFRRMGISPPLGMVLHGPPASDLMKAEIGESEKAITRAFDTARALSPCMIFIDEFQSLFGNRSTAGQTTSRMISQLLMELDALKAVSDDSEVHASDVAAGRIFVLAATNALSAIDPAFLQPGRFENVVYVGLPNVNERKAILEIQRNKMPWSQDVELNKLVEETEGDNAASLIAVCQSAAIQAMQRIPANAPVDEQCIAMVDFVAALAKGNFDFQKPE
ncbi:P-loop containing nucleoside triphosphate hydrolase [Phytophthora cactorum]|nr:P-loop containing nucleoside triphosphate hydrolase [Phytophthora cactorum]